MSDLCLFLISCSLPLSKHISVYKEIPPPTWIRLAFHFISEPGCLSGPDHSVLIEPDSTAPVGLLNKLLRLCSACQPLSLPSLGSDFLPPLFLLLELKHLWGGVVSPIFVTNFLLYTKLLLNVNHFVITYWNVSNWPSSYSPVSPQRIMVGV